MCRFGITRTCVGACGLMSRNAITASSWWTILAGIFPATMSQKRQGTAD